MTEQHPSVAVDLTSISPGVSGGVEQVAKGVVSGLIDLGTAPNCFVSTGSETSWRNEFLPFQPRLEVVHPILRSNTRWQSWLRRALPARLKSSPVVGAVRRIRSRSVAVSSGARTVWYPFHRSVAAAENAVVTVHDLRVFEQGLESPMDQSIIRANVNSASAIICSWPHPYAHVGRLFPSAMSRVFLVPLPVLNPGRPVDRAIPSTGKIRLFFPGFVTPHKNHAVIIRVLALRPQFTLVCTGAEVESHGTQLRKLAEELGVSDRIEWRGYVSAEELEREYSAAHILVMPTKWEAASGPIFEAVVRELPFVASDIEPLTAQLRSLGLSVPTFDPDQPEELAAALDVVVEEYQGQLLKLKNVAPGVRARTWQDTAREYRQVFDWVSGTAPKPTHLQNGPC